MFRSVIVALVMAVAVAFQPSAFPAAGALRTQGVLSAGYVPEGLTPKEYAAQKAKAASKATANKKRFPKGNMGTDVKVLLLSLEKKKPGTSGHTFAKMKYNPDQTVKDSPRAAFGQDKSVPKSGGKSVFGGMFKRK